MSDDVTRDDVPPVEESPNVVTIGDVADALEGEEVADVRVFILGLRPYVVIELTGTRDEPDGSFVVGAQLTSGGGIGRSDLPELLQTVIATLVNTLAPAEPEAGS